MKVLLLGAFKIVSDKTIRIAFVKPVPKNGVCACVSVFYMNERRIPDGKCYGFAQETREQVALYCKCLHFFVNC